VADVSPSASLANTVGGAPVLPDGTFTISGLKPGGEYRLFINGVASNLWPESAMLGSVDLFDGPVALRAGQTGESLVVTFSAEHTELHGTLSGAELISPIFVIAFPVDRGQWGLERLTRATQPDANGHYRFENLPAGEYWVGAIGDVDPDAWRAASFLDRLAAAAVKVVLGHGERKQLDLTTGR
ncbi:MAG: hypothetical protein WCQ64_15965, partial [Acidobacteriota bacterium]